MIYLFTHTDLDGKACAVIGELEADRRCSGISVTYCDYDNVDTKIDAWMTSMLINPMMYSSDKGSVIYITDISVSDEIAEKLDQFAKTTGMTLRLIDHHQTAMRLLKYEWALIDPSPTVCGTSLFADYLGICSEEADYALHDFIDNVCLYDTWRFDQTDPYCFPIVLNYLSYILEKDQFITEMMIAIYNGFIIGLNLPDWLTDIAISHIAKDLDYTKERADAAEPISFGKYKARVVFASRCFSQIGHQIAEQYDDADFAIVYDAETKTAHLRGGDNSPNLGEEIAKPMGGGGHPKAAAFQFKETTYAMTFRYNYLAEKALEFDPNEEE